MARKSKMTQIANKGDYQPKAGFYKCPYCKEFSPCKDWKYEDSWKEYTCPHCGRSKSYSEPEYFEPDHVVVRNRNKEGFLSIVSGILVVLYLGNPALGLIATGIVTLLIVLQFILERL